MFNLKYEDIIGKIKEEKGLSDEDIKLRINDKLKQLSDLISREGAAYIIANELGVKIFESIEKKKLKIKDLFSGLSALDLTGKVITIFGVREFNKEGRKGKVGSFLLGDETGTIRVVLWDAEHIKEIENGTLKPDDVVKVKNCYVKDNNGVMEIHLGNKSRLVLDVKEEIGDVKIELTSLFIKKKIYEIDKEENNVGILGTIVQVFEPRFYEVCSECGKKVTFEEDKFHCSDHGVVPAKLASVINLYLDDGTGNIRVVAFRDQAKNLINVENISDLKNDLSIFENIKRDLEGKHIFVIGRVVRNMMFDRLEIIAREFREVNPIEIASDLVKEIVT